MRVIFKAQLSLANIYEAEQVVAALIRFERVLRRKGFGPWYRLAHEVKATRRKLQEDAGLLTADEHVEKMPKSQQKSRCPGRPLRKVRPLSDSSRRELVLERLAKLGTTTLDLSKMTTQQLERMAYELESGEPS